MDILDRYQEEIERRQALHAKDTTLETRSASQADEEQKVRHQITVIGCIRGVSTARPNLPEPGRRRGAKMTEPKFTPGPWHVEVSEDAIRIDICADPHHCGNLPICRMYGSMDTVAQDNANLIAAAPEMYEALKGAVQEACGACAMMHVSDKYDFIENGCPFEENEDCKCLSWIRTLRKARGESEVQK